MKFSITLKHAGRFTSWIDTDLTPLNIKGTLYSIYAKPSAVKLEIYNECLHRALQIKKDLDADCTTEYGALGGTPWCFTFGANYYLHDRLIAVYYESKCRRDLIVYDSCLWYQIYSQGDAK